MGRNVLAVIDMRDEYIRELLSALGEELELGMPACEPLAIEQYNSRSQYQIGIGYGKPNWARKEGSDEVN